MAYRILHIITTLSMGGAEAMIYKLLTHASNRSGLNHCVVSLSGPGYYGPLLEQRGLPVHHLSIDASIPKPKDVFKIYSVVKKWNPHVIQTWLYHADLIGLILGRFINVPKIVWNVRCSNMDLEQYPVTTRLIFYLLTKLSRSPDVIIANSVAGKKYHAQSGYAPKRWEIIPNGFDTDFYRPDNESRKRMRHALGIDEASLVVGMTARYDPMKDHGNFLRAAGKVNAAMPHVRFVLIGKGIDENNSNIADMIKENGLTDKVHLLGERTDLPNIYPVFDIFTLTSSFGEGFPILWEPDGMGGWNDPIKVADLITGLPDPDELSLTMNLGEILQNIFVVDAQGIRAVFGIPSVENLFATRMSDDGQWLMAGALVDDTRPVTLNGT